LPACARSFDQAAALASEVVLDFGVVVFVVVTTGIVEDDFVVDSDVDAVFDVVFVVVVDVVFVVVDDAARLPITVVHLTG